MQQLDKQSRITLSFLLPEYKYEALPAFYAMGTLFVSVFSIAATNSGIQRMTIHEKTGRRKHMKRFFAVLLVLLACATALPMQALAVEVPQYVASIGVAKDGSSGSSR